MKIKVNEYRNGQVKSLQVTPELSTGMMLPGEHTFKTETVEEITITSGEATINKSFFRPGGTVQIEKGETFTITCEAPFSYVCIYK